MIEGKKFKKINVRVTDKGFISFAAEKLEGKGETGGRESDETVQ
ncbi:MAG: hypothetical protein NTW28_30695 [Candidatus Solibacter sp.]|nr:hypothetical protein [Candidatus Solibacter sp.]